MKANLEKLIEKKENIKVLPHHQFSAVEMLKLCKMIQSEEDVEIIFEMIDSIYKVGYHNGLIASKLKASKK